MKNNELLNKIVSGVVVSLGVTAITETFKIVKSMKMATIEVAEYENSYDNINKLLYEIDKVKYNKNRAPTTNKDLFMLNVDTLYFIKLKDNNSLPIKIPSFLNLAIENLKKCSTVFDEIKIENKEPYTVYEFYFYVNDITKQLFKIYFKSARELFKTFYYLRLLNNHLIGKDTQYKIKNIKEK